MAGEPLLELYGGAGGALWALEHLADRGAVARRWDLSELAATLAHRQLVYLGERRHGTASFLIGESGLQLLEWRLTRQAQAADRLFAVVEGNLRNPVREALWGNSGTVLAAISMAERTGEARWKDLVTRSVQVLWEEMEPLEVAGGSFGWVQNLYGRVEVLIGAGHGFVGNVFPALRGADWVDPKLRSGMAARTLAFLQYTAIRGELQGKSVVNWAPRVPPFPPEKLPLVQDCHGAPGVLSRLCGLPRNVAERDAWEALLLAAGEFTWQCGPLVKGVAFCHGTAGNAYALLKLFERTGDELWLQRARAFAMHGIVQVEQERQRYGQGRHTLWTGDLGMACVLWDCITGRPGFPTLDLL